MSDEPEIIVNSDDESVLAAEVFDRDFCYAAIRKLRAELGASQDPGRAAFLCHCIGWIFERHLGDPQQASTHYQEALSKDPELRPSIRALRRRALAQGNWPRFIELTDREISLTHQPDLRAQLRVEKAEVLDTQLDEPTIALGELQMALGDVPGNLQALWCLENLNRSRRNIADLAETLNLIASSLPEGELTRSLSYEAAHLREVGLDDPVAATEEYEAIVAGPTPDHRARAALRRLYLRSGDLRKLVSDMRAQAGFEKGVARARTLYTVARILNDRMGELVEALSVLEDALEADPDSSLVLAELVRLYPLVGKLERLAYCYGEQIRLSSDPREKAALYHRLGQLHDEQLQEDDIAEEYLWKALEQDPENRPALTALAVFYQKRKRFEDLVALHLEEAESTNSPMRKALACHRAAEILEAQGELDRAKDIYSRALAALPGFVPSFNALEQLLERSSDNERLVLLLRDRAEREENPILKARVIERTARILEERMQDREGAYTTYREILDIDPTSRTAVGALVRLSRDLEMWDDLARYLLMEADFTDDDQNVVSILLRVGEIQETRLQDEKAAIETYQRLLNVNPFYPPAIRNLGRLYHRRGMLEELINLHRQELDFTTEADERSLIHYRIGRICEDRVGDPEAAASAYKAAILENPRNFAASWSLYRIFLKREDWLSIIDILESEAGELPEGAQRAMALVRVGELWAEMLERPDMAADAYTQALRVHPGCTEAREALLRISEREGNWERLADLLYQQMQTSVDPEDQYRLALQLGELALDRTNNPRKAMEWYMKALALRPDSVAALRGTEHALRAAGEWRSFLEVRRKLMRVTGDEQFRLALFHGVEMLDHLHGHSLKKGEKVPLLDVDDLEFSQPGTLGDLVLEREIIENGDPGARLRFFESRMNSDSEPLSMKLADGLERAEALLAAGLVDDAHGELSRIASEDAASLFALLIMERVAEKTGDEVWLVDASTKLGDALRRPSFKAESLVRRGVARLEAGQDREQGLEDLRQAMALDPENTQGFSALVHAMGTAGQWEKLVATVLEIAERVLSPERAVEICGTLGSLQWKRLGDPTAAIKSYNRVLKHDARHAPTLMNLVDLYTEQDRLNDAIAVCRHLMSGSPDRRLYVEAAVKLTDLLDRSDLDVTEALNALEGILESEPDNRDVLERLVRQHRKNGDIEAALAVIEKLVDSETDESRRAALLTDQAELLCQSGGQSEAVLDLLERAIDADPVGEKAHGLLIEVMEKLGRWEDLTVHIRSILDRIDEDDVRTRSVLLTHLSRVYREHLNDGEKAAVTLKEAFDLDPVCSDTGALLVDGLIGSDRFGDALVVCERMLDDEPFCLQALSRLARVLSELGQRTRACIVAQLPFYLGDQDALCKKLAAELRAGRNLVGKVGIEDADMDRIRADVKDHPVRQILELLGEPGSKAMRKELGAYGVDRADRLDGKQEHGEMLFGECERAARLLGVKEYDVLLTPSQGAEVTVEMHRPPALLFSVLVTELSEVEQRILAVQALAQVRFRTAPAHKLSAEELEELFIAVARIFRPGFGSEVTGIKHVQELRAGIEESLTKKQLKALEEPVERYTQGSWIDFEEWHCSMASTAARLAVLATGDVGSVLDAIKKRDPVLVGVPLANPQARREAFSTSSLATDLVRFVLDPATVQFWERYVGTP